MRGEADAGRRAPMPPWRLRMLPISNVAIPNVQFQSIYAKATADKLELATLALATFPHWQHLIKL